jgi:hypothetical protein
VQQAQTHAQALYTLADGGPVDWLASFFEIVLRVRLIAAAGPAAS